MANFSELRQATLAARERTQDQTFGLEVSAGLYAVVRAIPPASGRGKYVIDYQSAGLTAEQAKQFLDKLGRAA